MRNWRRYERIAYFFLANRPRAIQCPMALAQPTLRHRFKGGMHARGFRTSFLPFCYPSFLSSFGVSPAYLSREGGYIGKEDVGERDLLLRGSLSLKRFSIDFSFPPIPRLPKKGFQSLSSLPPSSQSLPCSLSLGRGKEGKGGRHLHRTFAQRKNKRFFGAHSSLPSPL